MDLEHGLPIKASYYRDPISDIIYQYPIPNSDQLRSFYPPDYRPQLSSGVMHQLKLLQARMSVKNLSIDLPSKDSRILDIGCGGGHLLIELRRQGYQNLTAMDWSEDLRQSLEAQAINFIAGDIEEDLGTLPKFDFIILNNVIEHLAEPDKTLSHLKDRLKPKGRILLITPNERSLSHRVFGRNWSGLHAPRHVYIFNLDTLVELAKNNGFNANYRLFRDPSTWAISMQNLVRQKFRLVPPFSGISWYTFAFLPLCIIPAVLEHMFQLSSSMIVVLNLNNKY